MVRFAVALPFGDACNDLREQMWTLRSFNTCQLEKGGGTQPCDLLPYVLGKLLLIQGRPQDPERGKEQDNIKQNKIGEKQPRVLNVVKTRELQRVSVCILNAVNP